MGESNGKAARMVSASGRSDGLQDYDDQFLPRRMEGPIPEYAAESDGFRQACPRLYTLLAKQMVKGKKRELATIRFFVDGGRFKAAVHDRDSGQTWWTTLDAAGDLCGELEASLAAGKGEWRKDKPPAR